MLGYMNRAMLAKTLETGDAWFWSRSRQRAWHKGETSGHVLRVRAVRKNCYDNSLLLLVEPAGPVCHTGARTCYFRALDGTPVASAGSNVQGSKSEVPDAAAGSGEPDDRPEDRAGHEWRGAEEDGLDWLF